MATAKTRGRQATAKPPVTRRRQGPEGRSEGRWLSPRRPRLRRRDGDSAVQTTDEQFEQLTEPQLVTMLVDLPGAPDEASQAGTT